MTDSLEVRGSDLRYLLTAYLFDHGPSTIAELIDALTYHGFHTAGGTSKAVSDALRWEIGRGRVLRLRRGRYCPRIDAARDRAPYPPARACSTRPSR